MINELEILKQKITKYKTKKFWVDFTEKITEIVNLITLLFFVLIVIEIILKSESSIREIEFYFIVIVGFVLTLVKILPVIYKYFTKKIINYAGEIGKINPAVKDDLQNIIELDQTSTSEEKEFVEAAVQKLYNKLKDYDFSESVSFKTIQRKIFFSTIVVLLFSVSQFYHPINLSAKSLLFYKTEFYPKEKIDWEITPGTKKIIKGKNVFVSAKLKEKESRQVEVNYKNALQSEWQTKKIFADSLNTFSYTIKELNYDTEYFFSHKKNKSQTYKLSVIDYPEINSLQLKIISPAYAKQSPVFQLDNGNITALKGSKVDIKIGATKELSEAKMTFENRFSSLNVQNKKSEGNYLIRRSETYFFEVTDTSGYKNIHPVEYTISVINDTYPEIELIRPSNDVKLGSENSMQFELKLKDDFGFNKLFLNYRLSKSLYEKSKEKFRKINLLISKNELEQTKYFLWNMDSLNLVSGDEISYFFSVSDNDTFSGPKISKTKIYKIIVPSIDEILSETNDTYSDTFTKLDEVADEAEKLKEDFAKLKNDLKKKDSKLKYTEKEKIKAALERYEKLVEKTKETAQNLNNIKEKLSENNLLSGKTLSKYKELQNLFDEIGSEELKKAFQDMNNLLDKMNRKDVQNKFEQMKFNEELFQKSLERTINLLKRLQAEQKVENIKNRLENILQEQKELINNSENLTNKTQAKKQEKISEQIKQTKKEAEELKSLMDELKNLPSEEMQKFLEQMQEQKSLETSQQAQKELNKGEASKAQQSQQKVEENISSLQNSMNQIQAMMEKKNQMEVLYGLVRIFNGVVELTETQEKINLKLKPLENYSSELSRVAQTENFIVNQLSSVFTQANKLGQKSFLITPELGKALGDAKRNLGRVINNLSDGRKAVALRNAETVIVSLNKSSLIIKKLIDMMLSDDGSSGSQGGMSMMQQLKKMGNQQMSLNQMTQKMLQGKKLSSQQMGQMQRMAQQQEVIKKSLEQLNKENQETGKSKTLSQNLEKILDEMKEVVKKMQNSDFDQELKNKQDKILSKLLDAQKSVSDRDYEDKRKSSQGKEFRRLSPEEINNLKNISDSLKEELIKSLKEGYSKDYEDLIRRYFEKLRKNKEEK
ncbi:MAG: DUF4175 family protein [Rhodothermaceae bacterium]